MVHMSRRKSVFGLIEHCSTEVVLPTPIDQGRQKRQYFHFSTRSSGEKLTIFVNLYDNTDLHAGSLPGGNPHTVKPPIQIPWLHNLGVYVTIIFICWV